MYVEYTDLIQIGIFICALVGLCYTIFWGKRKQPPLLSIMTANLLEILFQLGKAITLAFSFYFYSVTRLS